MAQAHQTGHRQRLRERFLASGGEGLADYEILEMILFSAIPRADTKPLAKELIKTFGSLSKVFTAPAYDLAQVKGMGEAAVVAVKTIQLAASKMLQGQVMQQSVLSSWQQVLDYCQLAMASLKVEQFRVLFLDNKNKLIRDEVQQEGTINHTPLYPREVVKRALELGAAAIIMVHNHPSGDPTPSKADIEMTKQVAQAAKALDVVLHDHLIIGIKDHFSFKSMGLI